MRSTCPLVSIVSAGVALIALVLAPPALGKSAADGAAPATDYLPAIGIRLLYASAWDSHQSTHGESLGTFEMEGGIGILATLGTGDKESWHGEAEVGLRRTAGTGGRSLVGSVDTWSLMANGYFGFKLTKKVDGYVGAGFGLARHREDRGSDLALGYQGMVGIHYELTEKIIATAGLRYFATQGASLGRIDIEYRRPEVEVGIGYEF